MRQWAVCGDIVAGAVVGDLGMSLVSYKMHSESATSANGPVADRWVHARIILGSLLDFSGFLLSHLIT